MKLDIIAISGTKAGILKLIREYYGSTETTIDFENPETINKHLFYNVYNATGKKLSLLVKQTPGKFTACYTTGRG